MESERITRLEQQVARMQRRQRALMVCFGLMGLFLLVAWRFPPADVVQAKRFEALDDAGKVRVRIEPGRLVLLNKEGKEKALLTADENNGNLTLSGKEKMRLSVFMSEETPVVVLYNPKGEPVAGLSSSGK
jgi:hypothetical protein